MVLGQMQTGTEAGPLSFSGRTAANAGAITEDHDDQVVARVLGGDREAFALLVERHHTAVHATAYRLLRNSTDAADAAQETFVRAYLHLTSYQPGGRFKVWLLRITNNYCIDQLRRRQAVPLDEQGLAHLSSTPDDQPEPSLLRQEWWEEMQAQLATLNPIYREVLMLHAWHELTYLEISRLLNQPLSTVRMRLFRARKALRDDTPARRPGRPRRPVVA